MAEPPAGTRPDGYGITITRVFDAPRERVWSEWTEPAAFADWFGGPESEEVSLSTVEMDVRPGGTWRLTMYAQSGRREMLQYEYAKQGWGGFFDRIGERLAGRLAS